MKYKIVRRECPCCDRLITILLPETAYEQWESGKPIQEAWPEGSATERETLISGLCSICQEEVFQEEDND